MTYLSLTAHAGVLLAIMYNKIIHIAHIKYHGKKQLTVS